jgi:hypothetical protein
LELDEIAKESITDADLASCLALGGRWHRAWHLLGDGPLFKPAAKEAPFQ